MQSSQLTEKLEFDMGWMPLLWRSRVSRITLFMIGLLFIREKSRTDCLV